jgi:hypothetical protein
MATQIHSVHAQDELKEKLTEVRQLLANIETELQKYETLEMVHYGHVGDLGRVEDILGEAWEFITEAE